MVNANGTSEIRALYDSIVDNYSGRTHTSTDTVIEGNQASVELITVGIHRETGNQVTIPNVALLTFNESGKVSKAHVYLDMKNIENQIRVNN